MAATNDRPPNVNERTYQEVEYLKKNLGPVLVAALAEICMHRPADPIEYLGHWLLCWRYNEELKRRDVQNALEVIRQKQWDNAQAGKADPNFMQGVTPGYPNLPPGYGGPFQNEPVSAEAEEGMMEAPPQVNEQEYGEFAGEMEQPMGERASVAGGQRTSLGAASATGGQRTSLGSKSIRGEQRKVSGGPNGSNLPE